MTLKMAYAGLRYEFPFKGSFDISVLFYLGIEFYLFVSHSGMKDRGSTCKFRNARSAFRNLHVDPRSLITL